MVSISACHADDPGSIPGRGVLKLSETVATRWSAKQTNIFVAAIAQLGERQTEDLEVPGSIPGLGTLSFALQRAIIWGCCGN